MAPTLIEAGQDCPASYGDDALRLAPPHRAGVLLHPTSLPGPFGIGDLGPEAFAFVDWLHLIGFTLWQVLPLVPPGRNAGEDGCPYAGQDANCGNTLLMSLEELVKDGLLEQTDLPAPIPVKKVDYTAVALMKDPLIAKAAMAVLNGNGSLKDEMEAFRSNPHISAWVEDAAIFAVIDSLVEENFWWDWPVPLRDRHKDAIEEIQRKHKESIDRFVAEQFLFQKQWQALRKYSNSKGIGIVGDIPIYVGPHSADVWVNRDQFELDKETGRLLFVSGVPSYDPTDDGQRWGSPLYDWKAMAKDGYSWWIKRMRRSFDLYDELRIDHFIGLVSYWAIPADAKVAKFGKWREGPGAELFDAIQRALGPINIIAEDLGFITEDVVKLRKSLRAPGMAILQAAFRDEPRNLPHLPHNHEVDLVVYPGTHDNDTSLGWWLGASDKEKEAARRYWDIKCDSDVPWVLITAAFSSVAQTAIITMQDIMGLDNDALMNVPGTQFGNWAWRMGESGILEELDTEAKRLHDLLVLYNRCLDEAYQCK